jgi:uncharacterized protein
VVAPARTEPRPPGAALLTVALVATGWTAAGVLGAVALGGRAGHPLHLVGLLGPGVAVLCATRGAAPGYAGRLARRTLDLRAVPGRWWAVVVALGVVPGLVAGCAAALTGESPAPVAVGAVVPAVAFALAAGLVEEPAWRGVAQDAPIGSAWPGGAVVVGLLWTVWHLPLYILPGTYQHALGLGTADFWISMVARLPLAVLLAWLVHRTGGLVVAAVVAHALGNVTGELLPTTTGSSAVEALVLGLGAGLVVAGGLRARRAQRERS